MIDAFEITLRFLSVIVIKEYLDAGNFVEAFNELLVEKLFKKMSLGDWLALFREGSRCLAQEENLFFPELNAYAFKRGSGKPKSTKIMESFDRLITVRNRFKGHSTNCTEKEYQELYEECLPHIEAIWEGGVFNLSPLLYFYISYEEEEEHCCLYEENGIKRFL